MASDPTFVLLHSPLVGPASWEPVRDELHLRGFQAVAPRIEDSPPSYWRSYVDCATEAITDLGADDVVLVPHSGAGPLVAALADLCVPRVAGVVFVDAMLPVDGQSRLEEIESGDRAFAESFRADLDAGARYPEWSDAFLAPLVPDGARRAALLAEVQPRARDFFEEPIPAPGWPIPRLAYLQLSASYGAPAAHASSEGWPVHQMPIGHFGGLVEPGLVASHVIRLFQEAES